MIYNTKEIKFLDRILLEFPELKTELQKVSSNLKAAALLYCFLGDKANNVRGSENSIIAKKLQNIVLLYFSNINRYE